MQTFHKFIEKKNEGLGDMWGAAKQGIGNAWQAAQQGWQGAKQGLQQLLGNPQETPLRNAINTLGQAIENRQDDVLNQAWSRFLQDITQRLKQRLQQRQPQQQPPGAPAAAADVEGGRRV